MLNDLQPSWRFFCEACQTMLEENPHLCPHCFTLGRIFRRYHRKASEYAPNVKGVTAHELIKTRSTTFPIECLPGVKVGPSCFIILWGPPSGGKSTLGLKMASEFLPSAYLPLEMKIGPLLAEMCARLEVVSPKVRFEEPQCQRDVFAVAQSGVRMVVIDSVTVATLTPDDVHRIVRGSNVIVVGILQATKAGLAAGPAAWLHASDCTLHVEDMKWELEKSRFQPTGLKGDVVCNLDPKSTVSVA